MGAMNSKGFSCWVEGKVMQIRGKRKFMVMQGTKQGNLYILQRSIVTGSISVVSQFGSHVSNGLSDNSLWHLCMDILSNRGLCRNHKVEPLQFFKHCVYGKQHQMKFPKVVHIAKPMLNYIHSEYWGPSRVPSLGGARYFLSIIDDYSRMTWVFMMKQKFEIFKHWMILIKNQTGKIVKCLRTDNDLKFFSTEFCRDEDITRQCIVHYTPQQNRVAKRMNKTLLERVRCMLSNSDISRSFQVEAVSTICYLVNCSSCIAIDFKTPIVVWPNKLVEYSMLKVFGCLTYYHVSEGKLEPKAKKGFFMCQRNLSLVSI